MPDWLLAFFVIGLAIVFTFSNGVQDGSSVTAGVISCRAMSPARAVLLVASFELAGALFGGSAVANMVSTVTTIPQSPELLKVLAAALTAATGWNYATKILRFPSSSTHALFGGLIGAAFAAGGQSAIASGSFDPLHASGMGKAVISLICSPVLGFLAGYVMLGLVAVALLRATTRVNKALKVLQIGALCVLAFGHGANDPQKAMGIIMLALGSAHLYTMTDIPLWVRLSTGLAIAFGVIAVAPGIVRRVGKIYKMRMLHGFVLQMSAGGILFGSSLVGFPVSTSQVISSTLMGIGTSERVKDVHWLVARDIVVSWCLTIPCTSLVAGGLYLGGFKWLSVF